MDWRATAEGISRDLGELAAAGPGGWVTIVAALGLPVLAVVAILRGRRIGGALALAAWLAPALWWAAYYGVEQWANPGTEGLVRLFSVFFVPWFVLGVDNVVRTRRSVDRGARASSA